MLFYCVIPSYYSSYNHVLLIESLLLLCVEAPCLETLHLVNNNLVLKLIFLLKLWLVVRCHHE